MNYNEINRHSRDSQIQFDSKSHIYTYNGRGFKSITRIVEECFEQFDTDYWAKRKAPSMLMSIEAVKDLWSRKAEKARSLGTLMHEKIERFYLGLPNESDPTYKIFEQFTRENELNPYRTEWLIYDEETEIAGTLDFLDYQDGVFTIYDWKRCNKAIVRGNPVKVDQWGKRALKPIQHVYDTKYWHYVLQISFYRYILEKKYGLSISNSRLAVFHPECYCPQVVDVPYMKKEVIDILRNRMSEIHM